MMLDIDFIEQRVKYIEDFIRNRIYHEFPVIENYHTSHTKITIRHELYEELFKFLDSRDEYKSIGFNDFIEHLLTIGMNNIVAVDSIKKDK